MSEGLFYPQTPFPQNGKEKKRGPKEQNGGGGNKRTKRDPSCQDPGPGVHNNEPFSMFWSGGAFLRRRFAFPRCPVGRKQPGPFERLATDDGARGAGGPFATGGWGGAQIEAGRSGAGGFFPAGRPPEGDWRAFFNPVD